MATYHNQLSFPLVGNVTIHFNDTSAVTHAINTIGTTQFDAGTLLPVSIDFLGVNYPIPFPPTSVTYPDNSTGTLSCNGTTGTQTVVTADIVRPKR